MARAAQLTWRDRGGSEAVAAPWDVATARAARRQIVRLGMPACAQLCAEVGVFSLVSVLVGSMGATVAGAHQTAIMLASLSFSVCVGFGTATGVHVGHAIGRGDAPRDTRGRVGGRRAGGGVYGALRTLYVVRAGGFAVPSHARTPRWSRWPCPSYGLRVFSRLPTAPKPSPPGPCAARAAPGGRSPLTWWPTGEWPCRWVFC